MGLGTLHHPPAVRLVEGADARYAALARGAGRIVNAALPYDNTRSADRERPHPIGVAEYFLYDPRDESLAPPLQGYRLHGGGYEALASVAVLPGGGRSVHSAVLGLELREAHGGAPWLRLHDPVAGRDLPTYSEATAAREAAEVRAEREAAARQEAETHAAREAAACRAAEAQVAELKARLQDMENTPAHSHRAPRRSSR